MKPYPVGWIFVLICRIQRRTEPSDFYSYFPKNARCDFFRLDQCLRRSLGIVVDVNREGYVWPGGPSRSGRAEVKHDGRGRYDRSLTESPCEPLPGVR